MGRQAHPETSKKVHITLLDIVEGTNGNKAMMTRTLCQNIKKIRTDMSNLKE
jgi:hypothetical protein